MYVPIRARGQDGFAQTAREGGSDPTKFWAAESRTMWGRSRPFRVFARVQICVFSSSIFFFHFDLSVSVVENRKENREETLFSLGFPPILEL